MLELVEKIIVLNGQRLFDQVNLEVIPHFIILLVLVIVFSLAILSAQSAIYKLLFLGMLSLVVVIGWAYVTEEFLFIYLGYIIAFTGAVLMLFLGVILMLPISLVRPAHTRTAVLCMFLLIGIALIDPYDDPSKQPKYRRLYGVTPRFIFERFVDESSLTEDEKKVLARFRENDVILKKPGELIIGTFRRVGNRTVWPLELEDIMLKYINTECGGISSIVPYKLGGLFFGARVLNPSWQGEKKEPGYYILCAIKCFPGIYGGKVPSPGHILDIFVPVPLSVDLSKFSTPPQRIY